MAVCVKVPAESCRIRAQKAPVSGNSLRLGKVACMHGSFQVCCESQIRKLGVRFVCERSGAGRRSEL